MATLPPDLESLLVEQIREAKRGWRAGAITMVLLMLVLGAIAWFAIEPPQGQRIAALAGFGVLVGFLLFIPSLGDPAKARILETLRTRADRIVWLYVFTQRGQGAGSWIVIGFDDGKRDRITAAMGREEEVLRAISTLAPRATLGFSPELEARFLRAPVELRRP